MYIFFQAGWVSNNLTMQLLTISHTKSNDFVLERKSIVIKLTISILVYVYSILTILTKVTKNQNHI